MGHWPGRPSSASLATFRKIHKIAFTVLDGKGPSQTYLAPGTMPSMQLRFRFETQTRVRFFPKEAALRRALSAKKGVRVLDSGLPFSPGGQPFLLPGGEAGKSWNQVERVLHWLSESHTERSQPLVAFGGGATLDLAALAASLYRRGLPLVLVPTTLLAMVDATLGGKTAVDRDGAAGREKNFAGTFYPAEEVWIWPGFLSTLPLRERISGAGEVWKTLWIAGAKGSDRALVDFVMEGKITPGLVRLLKTCLETKRAIVERDPLDRKRIREILNYGHTIGHALESLAGGRLSHGESVLWGMAAESSLLGRSGEAMKERAVEKIRTLGLALPPEFSLPRERWLPLLAADKKNKNSFLQMSILASPGKPKKREFGAKQLADLVRTFPKAYQP